MKPVSPGSRPESDARDRRIAALVSAAAPPLAPELCAAFDQAVEFAACEGKPVSAAIKEFLAEDWGPAQLALRKLVLPPVPFVPARLPVLPRAAAQLLLTSDETASVSELDAIAGSDPALAACLLSAANSALFGGAGEIYRLRDGVMRLGIPTARRVLLSASFSGLFASKALQELWEHSQAVASAASQLASLCGADGESAWAAGLLHDIGRLAFTVFPASMQAAQQQWLAAGFPLIYAETMAYGTDHAAFGAELLRGWGLPDGIVTAVAHHHRPECSASKLHAVVHLAEAAEEDLWSNMRKKAALDHTGLSREQLDEILTGVRLAAFGKTGRACE